VIVRKDAGDRIEAPLAEAVRRRRGALRRQVASFGSRTPASRLFGLGRYRALLGQTVPPETSAIGNVELDFVQRAAPRLLALGGRVPREVEAVAIVAGGRVVAVAPVFGGRFWSLAPTPNDEVRVLTLLGPPAESLQTR
jgi:hypothetical protein